MPGRLGGWVGKPKETQRLRWENAVKIESLDRETD